MSTLMSLFVKLGLDASDFDKGIDGAEKKAGALGASLMKKGAAIAAAGGLWSAAITAPLAGLGQQVIAAASDMGESVNAVNVVFGEGAAAILAYGQTAATTVGLSNTEFNKLATTTGAFLQNVGMNADLAGAETIKLTERAADLASVFNTDVSQALGAIQSGLKGEFNPLEQFGVKLNAAAIEARALEMGLADADGQLSDSAKSTAALALIYEQTAKVAGDFANTSDGLANSQRIANAQLTDAAAVLGVQLLPYAIQATKALSSLVTWFTALSPGAQTAILAVAGLIAVIGPLLVVIGSLMAAAGAISVFMAGPLAASFGAAIVAALPIIGAVLAIIAVIALLYVAWKNNWFGIQEKTAAVIAWVTAAFQTWLNGLQQIFALFNLAFQGKWYEFGQKLREMWDTAWNGIVTGLSAAWVNIQKTVGDGIANIIKWFSEVNWGNVGTDIVKGIAAGLTAGVGWLVDAAKAVAKAAWDALQGFNNSHSPSKLYAGEGLNMMAGLAKGIFSGSGAIEAAIENVSVAGLNAVGGEGSQTVNNWNMPIYTSQSPQVAQNGILLAQLMGGA